MKKFVDLVRTAADAFSYPFSAFTYNFPCRFFSHDGRDAAEGDFSAVRISVTGTCGVHRCTVAVNERALDPIAI